MRFPECSVAFLLLATQVYATFSGDNLLPDFSEAFVTGEFPEWFDLNLDIKQLNALHALHTAAAVAGQVTTAEPQTEPKEAETNASTRDLLKFELLSAEPVSFSRRRKICTMFETEEQQDEKRIKINLPSESLTLVGPPSQVVPERENSFQPPVPTNPYPYAATNTSFPPLPPPDARHPSIQPPPPTYPNAYSPTFASRAIRSYPRNACHVTVKKTNTNPKHRCFKVGEAEIKKANWTRYGQNKSSTKRIVVFKLSTYTSVHTVKDIFLEYGDIELIWLVNDQDNNRPNFAFIEFKEEEAALEAVKGMVGKVNFALLYSLFELLLVEN